MKLFANKKLFKKIVILLVIITLVNALTPLHMVSADDADTDFAGALFRPICQLFAGIGDLVLSGLQWIFIGSGNIKTEEIDLLQTRTYIIRYSPGIIFSNNVPGLDANFINPGNSLEATNLPGNVERVKEYSIKAEGGIQNILDECANSYGLDDYEYKTQAYSASWTHAGKINYIYEWNNLDDECTYMLIVQVRGDSKDSVGWGLSIFTDIDYIVTNEDAAYLYKVENSSTSTGKVIESTAAQLQKTVSKWYKALRLVALVALLSVLVYVGIRIIISSTGQEKAKYKKMIGDWVAAICILFILNYIMAFTMDIVSKVITVFTSSNLIGANGEDILMSGIRNSIDSEQYSTFTTFTYLILYLVLVVYTVIFTIHYLKRVVYLAFFTMIAPLIAVTYPIDKIKDGQAQAFGTWIKEYTFNAAIPVIHIIIYSALVGSAVDLANANPLYAIVCIAFLIPAEKFFKKLFGFEKANTVGTLGAATGGALIMNAINKMGHKSGKQAATKAGASTPSTSRGLSANAMSIASGDGSTASSGGAGGAGTPGGAGGSGGTGAGTSGGTGGSGTGGAGGTGTSSGTTGTLGSTRNANIFGPTIAGALRNKKGIRRGAMAIGRRFINKNTAKSAGRLLRKGILGAAGAGLGATAGLVAGISTGDFTNALKYGVVGAGSGFSGANYVGNKLLAGEKGVRETFKEGAIGEDEYSNLKADKEFYESEEFRSMVNNPKLEVKNDKGKIVTGAGKTKAMRNAVQTYRDNGITDTGKISTAMKLDLTPQEGAYAIRLAENIGRSGWNNKNVREDYEKRYRANIPSGLAADKIWNSIEALL